MSIKDCHCSLCKNEPIRLTTLDKGYVPEFGDLFKVLEMGAKKYGAFNWLEPNGKKSSFEDMHNSMFHHLSESYAGVRIDHESGLDPLLHLACRALMLYTRIQRKLV